MDYECISVSARAATQTINESLRRRGVIPLRNIHETVAKHCGISMTEFMSRRRHYDVVMARWISVYLCKVMTTRSWPCIGRSIDRDHTTALHGYQKMLGLLAKNADLAAEVAGLRATIEAAA